MNLINQVQICLTGADVSATSLPADDAGLNMGNIRVRDLRKLYPDDYTIFKLKLTGRQLKEYMEWSAAYYDVQPVETPSGTELSAVPAKDKTGKDCDIFYGVCYKINLSKPAGARIEDLCWPDGTPVEMNETFSLAVNRIRAAQLTAGQTIFPAGHLHAQIIQGDVHDEFSGLREMIGYYIENNLDGTLDVKEYQESFELTG